MVRLAGKACTYSSYQSYSDRSCCHRSDTDTHHLHSGDASLIARRHYSHELQTDNKASSRQGLYAGAVAFAAAHVIYFAAFLFSVKGRYFNVGAICGIALFVLISVCMPLIFPHGRGENRMLFLGLLYLFFIALNYITVYSCAASHGGIFWVSAVGVTSFLISDLFIAADKILGRKIKNSDLWIWTLYPIGQLLLLIGA